MTTIKGLGQGYDKAGNITMARAFTRSGTKTYNYG